MVDTTYKIQFFDTSTHILHLTIENSDSIEKIMLKALQKEISDELDREILTRMMQYAIKYNNNTNPS